MSSSSNLNYKQVAGANRRTWDVETYAQRARARQQAMERGETETRAVADGNDRGGAKGGVDDDDKEEFRPALKGAAGPEGSDRAFLQKRSTSVMQDLEAQVGQSTFVDTTSLGGGGPSSHKSDGVVTATGVGWHCKVCDCFLKDSHTYLDHINGRKHQRKLGYSMHVQRSTADDVQSKLQALVRHKKEAAQKSADAEIDFHERVRQKDQELRERQEERRRKRKERKKKAKQQQQEEDEEEQVPEPQAQQEEYNNINDDDDEGNNPQGEEEEEAQIDPALAAMMGFSGFGGGAKN